MPPRTHPRIRQNLFTFPRPFLPAITKFDVTLQHTELNDPNAEFPYDHVRLDVIVTNVGGGAAPPNSRLTLSVYQNDRLLGTVAFPFDEYPGPSWPYTITDRFSHGVPTVYKALISGTTGEQAWESAPAIITIDERKLHPSGVANLRAQVTHVLKSWDQEGTQFKPSFEFKAEVENTGTGYSQTGSVLTFFSDDAGPVLASPLSTSDLPGPGTRSVFVTERASGEIPSGKYAVRVKVDPVGNETKTEDNISGNADLVRNDVVFERGDIFRLSMAPKQLDGRRLRHELGVQNLQWEGYSDLRLMLRKIVDGKDTILHQWGGIDLGPRESMSADWAEAVTTECPRATYRAVLTSDPSSKEPPETTVLDVREADVNTLSLHENLLTQWLAADLPSRAYAYDSRLRIHSVKATVDVPGVRIAVTGKVVRSHDIDINFSVVLLWHPWVENHAISGWVEVLSVDGNAGWLSWLLETVCPWLYEPIREILVEQYASQIPFESMSPEQLPLGKLAIITAVPCKSALAVVWLAATR